MHWKVINHTRLIFDNVPRINQTLLFSTMFAILPLFATSILLTNTFSLVTAQSLIPGIHGMSIVQGVKFTWVIISSDNEISVNLRHVGNSTGNSTTPAVTLVATALTNPIQVSQTRGDGNTSNAQTTMGGSQILNAGWQYPSSVTIKIEGSSSLYNADLVTVVASPYTGG